MLSIWHEITETRKKKSIVVDTIENSFCRRSRGDSDTCPQ